MKKSDSIKQKISNLKKEALELTNKEGVTKEELIAKREEIEAQEAALELTLKLEKENSEKPMKPLENKTTAEEYKRAFYNTLRGNATLEDKMVIENALSSTTEADGGLLIPVDQVTEINELKRQMVALREFVTVETVSTKTGSRVIEKDADITPFAVLTEGAKISDTDSPQFSPIKYDIKDYAGILPIPNNLLKDSDTNIKRYLNKWLAKKSVATENTNILTILKAGTKKDIKTTDEIKDILNVELDPNISSAAIVLTNQDGFNVLDKLKDADGKYILQPDPTNPTKKLLQGKPVYVLSNKILKTATQKAPVIIGNLKEAIVLFDREQLSLMSTDIGAGAFENNMTKVRAIIRQDTKAVDSKAFVYGEISTAPSLPAA